jgi:hypothetical protein
MTVDSHRWQPLRRTIEDAIRLLSLLWLFVHFALTVAYVMPPNPMNAAWQGFLDATVGTYYSQNWQLFSPEPLTENYALYVRPLTDAQAAGIARDGLPQYGWFDITSPLLARFQQNRFSAYDRLTRPQINAILKWLSGGANLASWQQSCQMGDSKACAFYSEQLKLIRSEEGKVMARAASAFCNDRARSCQGATQVALRAHEEMGVPWSQRYSSAKPVTHDMDLGVYPIDRSAASANIYKAGRP